jgi:hypothetical protein
MRGQGATEYLVLLAAVLIIALVSLALLGFFPGMAGDAKISQSNSYWRSEAKPFSILEHALILDPETDVGNYTMVLQLKEATGKFRITNITVNDGVNEFGSANSTIGATGRVWNSGEMKSVTIPVTSDLEIGEVYEYMINITYVSPAGITTTQYGVKSLLGKVSG